MAYVSTIRLPNEPILICTYTDRLTVEDVRASTDDIERHIVEIMQPIIMLIIDTTATATTFQEMLNVLKLPDLDEPPEGMQVDVQMMMVGTDAMAKFYVNAAKQQQFGGYTIPLFARLEDAIEAARTAIRTGGGVNQPTTQAD